MIFTKIIFVIILFTNIVSSKYGFETNISEFTYTKRYQRMDVNSKVISLLGSMNATKDKKNCFWEYNKTSIVHRFISNCQSKKINEFIFLISDIEVKIKQNTIQKKIRFKDLLYGYTLNKYENKIRYILYLDLD